MDNLSAFLNKSVNEGKKKDNFIDIKFTIYTGENEISQWVGPDNSYRKIEYVYNDYSKGITVDFLLGMKNGHWQLWIGKLGAVSYDDDPYFDLKTSDFKDAVLNSLPKIKKIISSIKNNQRDWIQFYIKK